MVGLHQFYGAVIGGIEIDAQFKTREEIVEFELERRKIIYRIWK